MDRLSMKSDGKDGENKSQKKREYRVERERERKEGNSPLGLEFIEDQAFRKSRSLSAR